MSFDLILEKAWQWREQNLSLKDVEAYRVFHGPGEAQNEGMCFAVDRFKDHYWVTEWANENLAFDENKRESTKKKIIQFYLSKKAKSMVCLSRPKQGIPSELQVWIGVPPSDRFEVKENDRKFLIQFQNTQNLLRHPGLFLDHIYLRNFLEKISSGMRVLNTFSYTGSLSVAAARGNAESITTLDLSQSTLEWASENFKLNQMSSLQSVCHYGDYFEWMPRWKKQGRKFDCIILDPPSFSRGKKSNFSTDKDLIKLHEMALSLLEKNGILVSSINSAKLTLKKYESDILKAAEISKVQLTVLHEMRLPETFPTPFITSESRYLKGFVFQVSS